MDLGAAGLWVRAGAEEESKLGARPPTHPGLRPRPAALRGREGGGVGSWEPRVL